MRTISLALAVLLLAAAGASAEAPAPDERATRAVHLLDYMAVDYPETVADGAIINELEYAEQIEFSARVRETLTALGVDDAAPLAVEAAELEQAIAVRDPGAQVSARARALAAGLRDRFGVRALPSRPPDVARGQSLYAQTCASCHGPEGRGDGPANVGLDPPASDLHDPARMRSLSPFALYSTITFGIDGTSMAPFATVLADDARWDLAFFTASLPATPAERARGAQLAAEQPARVAAHVSSLQALIERTPAELADGDPDGAAIVAHLLGHPELLHGRALPLAIAITRVEDSWAAYRAGESVEAVELAISAYLDGYEHVEPSLAVVDPTLARTIEANFLRYREQLRAGLPSDDIEPLRATLAADLARAERRLDGSGLGPRATFLASLTILTREGLEAILLVVAITGVLSRAGRRDALPWVHAGWVSALVAGAATWWAAGRLIEISGARREVIEGLSALFASAILFYVSYWLVSKIATSRWQAFLGSQIREAASTGRLAALTGLTFVAVYRECFETVLFYQALAAQAGPAGARPLAAGIGAGIVLLATLAVGVFRFGRRLPLRHFFAASSGLLYALCIVLAGHGIAALQEAAWLPITTVPGPRVDWLGLHPTLEGLAVQGLLLLAALVAFVKLSGDMRQVTGIPVRSSPREGS
ncbi:FTR1 family protein [Myxococcota bacterium]|nr:FTR1 family protein [Myxococcota bacterium]MCZ7617082.1 FTR1 family protein [Myxococcota bacterium]